MSKPLTAAQIAALTAAKPKRGTKGKDAINTKERTYTTWFKLGQSLGFCVNEQCLDKRPRRTVEGNQMVAIVDSTPMCRICFLAGFGLIDG